MIEDDNESKTDGAEQHRRRNEAAESLAASMVAGMGLPNQVFVSGDFDSLGVRIGGRARKIHAQLLEAHKDALPFLIAIAVREMWFASWSAANYMKISSDEGDKSAPMLWTAEGYAKMNGGWAYTLYNELTNLKAAPARASLLEGTPYSDSPNQSTLLLAISTYWFDQANQLAKNGPSAEIYNLLHEAYEALSLEGEAFMWDAGFQLGKEESASEATSAARTALAKVAAMARHTENRAMKQDVFKWCDENMASAKSMDAAASRVAGAVVPAAWRTVRDWMTEWKKIRSAGTT